MPDTQEFLSRRGLMKAAGATLAAGLAASDLAGQGATQPKKAAVARKRRDRSFLCNDEFKNTVLDERKGFQVKARLTEYRSLPLSCIVGIELKVDGEVINPADLVFTLNGYDHRISDFARMQRVWWFVLDPATVFVPRESQLTQGEHEVEATLVNISPYATSGVHTTRNPAKKRLRLEEA